MSVCSDCIKAKPIARCITNLIIGNISSVSTAVYVYIIDTTTGRRIRYDVTTSVTGLITIPITPQHFSEDHSYEIYVTLASAINVNTKETISVSGEQSLCISLQFETILKNDNTVATYTNQTLTSSDTAITPFSIGDMQWFEFLLSYNDFKPNATADGTISVGSLPLGYTPIYGFSTIVTTFSGGGFTGGGVTLIDSITTNTIVTSQNIGLAPGKSLFGFPQTILSDNLLTPIGVSAMLNIDTVINNLTSGSVLFSVLAVKKSSSATQIFP